MERKIIHVDMDEFFAAVEKLDHPELRGKPLLIGGSSAKRGVVSTASYEARRFGCRSAMPMGKALRLCPKAAVLPVRMERYQEVSKRVFAILGRFTPLVEPASIDEAFLDVTGSIDLFGPAGQIAAQIKRNVRKETGVTASVGVAPNKFLAKLASDLDKPDGFFVINKQRIHKILDPLPVGKLWGVGPEAVKRFNKLNISTIGELRSTSLKKLTEALGTGARHYLNLANGLDERPVTPQREAKSMGREQTFPADISDLGELRCILLKHAECVSRRLRSHGLQCRTIAVKLRTEDFKTFTRSLTLSRGTNVTRDIWERAESLLQAWTEKHHKPLRLIGITLSNLQPEDDAASGQFKHTSHQREKLLDKALDKIAERFGDSAVHRGASGPNLPK